jgi:hypothetical protein
VNKMKNQEFSPRESLEHAFERWWVIVLLTVLGGLLGWAFHFFRSPVFEATAVMTASADFQKVKLTQQEEDYAFIAAQAIATSSDVAGQVIAAAQARGLPMDANQFHQDMFLETRESFWEFHVRNRDPQAAAALANLWVDKAYEALNTSLEHAMLADQVQAQINNIKASLSIPATRALASDEQAALKKLSDELIQENISSKGVISIMKFVKSESATVPSKITLYNLANLVLAGACVGFLVSLWVAGSYKDLRSV